MSCTRSGKMYSNASASVNANVSKEEVRPVFFEPRPASATRRSMRINHSSTQLNEKSNSCEQDEQPQSQPPQKYEVHIDFDDASKAWRSNKRRVGESWEYIARTPERISEAITEVKSVGVRGLPTGEVTGYEFRRLNTPRTSSRLHSKKR